MARGFAAMSKERVKEWARAGGKAAQAKGVGHRWDWEAATIAGRKGGLTTWARRKAREAGFDAALPTPALKTDTTHGGLLKRYLVTVERKVIVYAPSKADAGRKALTWMAAKEGPAMHSVSIAYVRRLPPVKKEAHGPEVDIVPARETR